MATCGLNPAPPPGTRIMRGTVPAPVVAWAMALRDHIADYPIHTTWTMVNPTTGGVVTARSDYHTWTYVNGVLKTGICIRGITVFESVALSQTAASSDPTDDAAPDPTAAIYMEEPQGPDWSLVILSGAAALGVVTLFLIALRTAGHR